MMLNSLGLVRTSVIFEEVWLSYGLKYLLLYQLSYTYTLNYKYQCLDIQNGELIRNLQNSHKMIYQGKILVPVTSLKV